ncbi:MAG: arsenate reductase ArsC [Candidatus Hermodarchaeota archaeon]
MILLKKKKNLIFICSHNDVRSQIAEAFLRNYASSEFNAFSAGFRIHAISPLTYMVMKEVGLKLTNHHPKVLKEFLRKYHFVIAISFCGKDEVLCPIFPGIATQLFWDIEDPSTFQGSKQEKLEKFREIRNKIEAKVQQFLRNTNEIQVIP